MKINGKSIPNRSKINQKNQKSIKSIKFLSTTHETSSKNRSKIDPGGPGVGPGALLGWSRRPLGPLDDSRTPPGKLLGRFFGHKRPTWLKFGTQLGSQHGTKIHRKSMEKTTLNWDRYFLRFWWIFDGKMRPCWHPNEVPNVHNFERRSFEKSCSHCSGGSIFEILGVEGGSKNRLKID